MSQPSDPSQPGWNEPGWNQPPPAGGVPNYGGGQGPGGYGGQPDPYQQQDPYAQPGAGQQHPYPQPGFGQQGFPPAGQYAQPGTAQQQYAGLQQAPGSGAGALRVVGIVLGALVVIAVVGGALASFGTRSAAPSIPEPPPPATTSPSRTEPTAQQESGQNSSEPIAIGNDVSVRPAPGWTVDQKQSDSVTLTNGDAAFIAQATDSPGVSAEMLLRTYLDKLGDAGTDVRMSEIKEVAGTGPLDVVTGSLTLTMAGADGSQDVSVLALISVRTEDGATAIGTMIYPTAADSDEIGTGYRAMTASMLESQVS